jgi:hypothetical protein
MNPEVAVTTQTAILARSFDLGVNRMSPEVAEFILSMELAEDDRQRLQDLAAKARQGSLSEADEAALEEYRRAGRLMEMMKLKARIVLKAVK